MKRGSVKASESRSIGGVRDTSAPTGVSVILLISIIKVHTSYYLCVLYVRNCYFFLGMMRT